MHSFKGHIRAHLRDGTACFLALSSFCVASAAAGQSGPVISREVVQPLPPASTSTLNTALQRLANNPRDAGALVDAGFAALDIGDVDAAVGFFSRADSLDPGNARAKAGLGAAYVRSENPYDALLMFEEADKAGGVPAILSADRGLAHDLVGDTGSAQAYYRKALALGPNAQVTRRLAVSLAISGDRNGAEAALLPLLRKQDLGAYRSRAFVLAILGDAKAAQDIVDKVMPRDMASKLAPYLRYMPRLTAAQQAAAANFGHFPQTAHIGKDNPRAARYANNTRRAPVVSASLPPGQSALVPAGEPLGRKTTGSDATAKAAKSSNNRRAAKQTSSVALAQAAEAPVARAAAPVAQSRELPPVAQANPGTRTGLLANSPAVSQQAPAMAAVPSANRLGGPATTELPPARASAPYPVASVAAPPTPYAPATPAPAAAPPALAHAAPVARTGDVAIASFGAGQTRPAPAGPATAGPQGDPSFIGPHRTGDAGPGQPVSGTAPVIVAAAAVARNAAPRSSESVMAAPAYAPVSPPATNTVPTALSTPTPGSASAPAAAPGFASLEPASPVSAPPATTGPVSLADAFADFTLPSAPERVAGAVDIMTITPRREAPPAPKLAAADPKSGQGPKADPKEAANRADPKTAKGAKAAADAKSQNAAKPKPPAHPARQWVQVATGRDTGALAFDWRRMSSGNAELFKGRQPYVAKWGQTNRLVTGPFPNAGAAQEFVSKLKKAGVNAFTFASSEGESVSVLKAGR